MSTETQAPEERAASTPHLRLGAPGREWDLLRVRAHLLLRQGTQFLCQPTLSLTPREAPHQVGQPSVVGWADGHVERLPGWMWVFPVTSGWGPHPRSWFPCLTSCPAQPAGRPPLILYSAVEWGLERKVSHTPGSGPAFCFLPTLCCTS